MIGQSILRRSLIATAAASGAGLLLSGTMRAAGVGEATGVVETAAGRVRGMRSGGVSRFLGIQRPPVDPFGGQCIALRRRRGAVATGRRYNPRSIASPIARYPLSLRCR